MGILKDLIIKLGLDSSGVDKGVNQAGGSLDKLKGMVGKVGAAMGIAFGVSELINFGKEIVSIASKTEGVKRAFDRLGMPSLMNELKQATRGAVSEFDLMKTAVSANNFKIPLENLGSYLEFATRRAEETGQSVDYLVFDGDCRGVYGDEHRAHHRLVNAVSWAIYAVMVLLCAADP